LSDRSKWLRIFLATKLEVFSDSKESLKLFSNYPSMISNTRCSPQTQRVRERERESFGCGAVAWVLQERKLGSFHCRLGRGGGGVLIFPSSQVLRIRGSGSRF
jgi:hypothetical protein